MAKGRLNPQRCPLSCACRVLIIVLIKYYLGAVKVNILFQITPPNS